MTSDRKRFSMAAVPKRKMEDGTSSSPQKVQKASQLVMVEQGPRPANPNRLPDSAPVQVVVYKVTDSAGDCWSQYEGTEASLYQVQMKHEARPSALFDLNRSFGDFLKSVHAEDESVPVSLQDLQQCGIKLVLTDNQDPDGVGFVQWRPAFYVVGDPHAKPVTNFLLLLDEWWAYKSKAMGRQLEVQYHPHTSVGDLGDIDEQLAYEHCVVEAPSASVPLGIFEAQPVISKRIVTINVQPEGADTVSILVSGSMWVYRARFDAQGIPGNTKQNNNINSCSGHYSTRSAVANKYQAPMAPTKGRHITVL